MPEPSQLELLLKIEKLEKALKVSRQASIDLIQARDEIAARDRELATRQANEVRLDKTIEKLQKVVANLNNIVDNQNADINSLNQDITTLKKENKSLKDSLSVACSQRDNFAQTVKNMSAFKETCTALQNELAQYKNFVKGLVQPISSLQSFSTEVLNATKNFLK